MTINVKILYVFHDCSVMYIINLVHLYFSVWIRIS